MWTGVFPAVAMKFTDDDTLNVAELERLDAVIKSALANRPELPTL